MLFLTRQTIWLSGFFLVGLTSLLASFGPLLVRRFFALEKLTTNNEVAGFKFAAVAVLYAVLVAFAVIVVWQRFTDADATVAREAGAAGAIYHLSSGLDDPQASAVRNALTSYLRAAVVDEWPTMEKGQESPEAHHALSSLYKAIVSSAASRSSAPVISEMFNQVDGITQARRSRILAAEGAVPDVVWVALFIGAAVTISFTFFFGTINLRAQMLMTVLLSILIFSELEVAVVLDRPFTGPVTVAPDAITDILADHLDHDRD
jgi:Protein of unknown function (DUF4239)